jgi:hypothetical protein
MTRPFRILVWLGGLAAAGTSVVVACLPDIPAGTCGNGYIDVPYENCDPGANPNPGCVSCILTCPTGGYVDPTTGHCYFGIDGGALQTFGVATSICTAQTARAHVVTFVDDDEVADVSLALGGAWPAQSMFWVGDKQEGSPYFASPAYEPGWDKYCQGCFLHGVTGPMPTIPTIDGGLEAGPPSVIVSVNPTSHAHGTFGTTGQNALAEVLCEREPVGSRSTPCRGGSFCFQLPLTEYPPQSKSYVYNPTSMSATAAASYCRAIEGDAGTSSLVVFASRAEREEVIYELTQLQLLPAGVSGPPMVGFWVGLENILVYPDAGTHDSGVHDGGVREGGAPEGGAGDGGARDAGDRDGGARVRDGGAREGGAREGGTLVWTWEDGTRAGTTSTSSRPSVWGDHQPPAEMAGVYAYISLSDGYDTGLAYAPRDDSTGVTSLPFVCQY